MNEETKANAFEVLRSFYGSHVGAAIGLSIDPRHYRKIRQGKHRHPMTLSVIEKRAAEVFPYTSS